MNSLKITRIKLNSQGYDSYGRYWGVGLELEAEEALDELPDGKDIGSMVKRRFLRSRDGFWVRSPATNELVRLFKHEAEVVSP